MKIGDHVEIVRVNHKLFNSLIGLKGKNNLI